MIEGGSIKVYSSLSIAGVADMELEVKEGSHGKLVLRGFLSASDKNISHQGDMIKIAGKSEKGQEETIFQGLIQETYVFYENGTAQVLLTALSSSCMMDIQEHNRSFQDISIPCSKIVRDTVSTYHGRIDCEASSVQVGKPVVQYEETDWEFCKRMAGRMGLGVYGIPAEEKPLLAVGLVEGRRVSFQADRYRCCVDSEYYRQINGGAGRSEFLYYQVESEDNYSIGDSTKYQGRKWYIFEKRAELREGVLTFGYKLGGKYRFMKAEQPNCKITGASLKGTIERTEKETVYIKLDVDGENGKAIYPYQWRPATGNLMYCMPQAGTKANLYFPDCHEGNAYAVSSIRMGSACPEFENAQNRVFTTEHGKLLQLYGESIRLKSGRGGEGQQIIFSEENCMLKTGQGKLSLIGRDKIILEAPIIRISTAQEINQYRTVEYASPKEKEIYPRGSRNPATGGDVSFSMQYEFNGFAQQGILVGTEYEQYFPFADAPQYELDSPLWQKFAVGLGLSLLIGVVVAALAIAVVASGGLAFMGIAATMATQCGAIVGAITVGAGILAMGRTYADDQKNGTASSWGDYMASAGLASGIVGGSFAVFFLAPYAAEVMASVLGSEMIIIPELKIVLTAESLLPIFQGITSTVAVMNIIFQQTDLTLYVTGQKELCAPTGDKVYDTAKGLTEFAAAQIAFFASMNPKLWEDVTNYLSGNRPVSDVNLQEVIDYVKSMDEGGSGTVDDFINNNVNPNFQQNVKEAFMEDAKVTVLEQDTTVYRYYGGSSQGTSYWYTPNQTSNPAADLALPQGNTYQYMDTYVIPKGTTILEGTVAPNFGQPGGGYQYYVPDPSVLIKQ